jgi:hypothetical protein
VRSQAKALPAAWSQIAEMAECTAAQRGCAVDRARGSARRYRQAPRFAPAAPQGARRSRDYETRCELVMRIADQSLGVDREPAARRRSHCRGGNRREAAAASSSSRANRGKGAGRVAKAACAPVPRSRGPYPQRAMAAWRFAAISVSSAADHPDLGVRPAGLRRKIWRPKRLAARSTSSVALCPPWSRKGLSSTMSTEPTTPLS